MIANPPHVDVLGLFVIELEKLGVSSEIIQRALQNVTESPSFAEVAEPKIILTPTPTAIGVSPKKKSSKKDLIIPALENKFKDFTIIGKGSYGYVFAATCITTGERLAVKQIINIFHEEKEAKRVLIECKLLKHLKHSNVVELTEVIVDPPSVSKFKDVYLVFELMESTLHDAIYKKNLSDDEIKYFAYQLFYSLSYIHTARVLHRDLRPQNLLIRGTILKIADFGLSRAAGMNLTLMDYITKRAYEAPEGLLKNSDYSCPADIWSAGCILLELVTKKTQLVANSNDEQLKLIFNFIGIPKQAEIDTVIEKPNQRERVKELIQQLHHTPIQLDSLVPPNSVDRANLLDLLTKIFVFDPNHRITAAEVLQHPFFATFNINDKVEKSSPFMFNVDNAPLTRDEIRTLLFAMTVDLNSDNSESNTANN